MVLRKLIKLIFTFNILKIIQCGMWSNLLDRVMYLRQIYEVDADMRFHMLRQWYY